MSIRPIYKADYYSLFCMCMSGIFLFLPYFVPIELKFYPLWMLFSIHFNFCVNLINHNHSHFGIFDNRVGNFLVDLGLTLLRGASASFILIIHNINHHQYVGELDDWFSPLNEGEGNLISRSLRYVWVTARRFKKGAPILYEKMGKDFKRTQLIERIALTVFLPLIIFINFRVFLLFVLPTWILGNFFLVYTNLIFHRHADPKDRYNNSYNFTNRIENALYFNGGYHTIHHLRPSIHWSNLKIEHQELIAEKINPEKMKSSMFLHIFR